jgi:hypothetical protein
MTLRLFNSCQNRDSRYRLIGILVRLLIASYPYIETKSSVFADIYEASKVKKISITDKGDGMRRGEINKLHYQTSVLLINGYYVIFFTSLSPVLYH